MLRAITWMSKSLICTEQELWQASGISVSVFMTFLKSPQAKGCVNKSYFQKSDGAFTCKANSKRFRVLGPFVCVKLEDIDSRNIAQKVLA